MSIHHVMIQECRLFLSCGSPILKSIHTEDGEEGEHEGQASERCASLHSLSFGQKQVTGYSKQPEWLQNIVYLLAQERNKADFKNN